MYTHIYNKQCVHVLKTALYNGPHFERGRFTRSIKLTTFFKDVQSFKKFFPSFVKKVYLENSHLLNHRVNLQRKKCSKTFENRTSQSSFNFF